VGSAKPTGAQQSSSSPCHSETLSLMAIAETTTAANGSTMQTPAPAAMRATRAAAAWAAHMRFWIPSPLVAADFKRRARWSLVYPRNGMRTMAEAVMGGQVSIVVGAGSVLRTCARDGALAFAPGPSARADYRAAVWALLRRLSGNAIVAPASGRGRLEAVAIRGSAASRRVPGGS
jgi:hypothetical protein